MCTATSSSSEDEGITAHMLRNPASSTETPDKRSAERGILSAVKADKELQVQMKDLQMVGSDGKDQFVHSETHANEMMNLHRTYQAQVTALGQELQVRLCPCRSDLQCRDNFGGA